MRLAVISFKSCWQDETGAWFSSGGFPLQITAIASLFDQTTLLVVCSDPEPGGIPLPSDAIVRTMRKPHGSNLQRKLDVLQHLPYYIRTISKVIRQADVVHTPLPGDLPFLAMLIALFSRKHLIARYGGSWKENSRNTFMNSMTRLLMRSFAGGRCVMLATGEGAIPPSKNMHWIFSTALTRAELDSIHPDYDRGLSVPPRLVYLGRFSPEKGIPVFLQAVSCLKETDPKMTPDVILIGTGPEMQNIQNIAADLHLNGRIQFTGQLDRQSMSARMINMDICVQASLTEGFSKAWLDSFAHGVPVIASEVGASADVIGQNGERGWLVKPGDIEMLTEQMRKILVDPLDWPALRHRCRAYAEQFTLEAWTERIGQICAAQWKMAYSQGKLRL